MNKLTLLLWLLCGLHHPSHAANTYIEALKHFHPEEIIAGYTLHPAEESLQSQDEHEPLALISEGLKRSNEDQTTHFVKDQEANRNHAEKNNQAPEIQYAERLLNNEKMTDFDSLPCIRGECDESQAQETDDLNEGFSRLGALTGTAEAAAQDQTQLGNHAAFIFKGVAQECERYPLGTRDCCTDSGFLDGFMSCPSNMQALQRAKLEGRVRYLGHYKNNPLSKTRYAYCVFPTRLAAIVQLEGREGQLHVSFGTPKKPDCRGITPEQLERIDFKKLNLGSLVNELVSRPTLPNSNSVDHSNTSHIEHLHATGASHD
jgi:conjugal transfer mating pair stabilization protein TraN